MDQKNGDGVNPLERDEEPTCLQPALLPGSRTRYGRAEAEGARARQGIAHSPLRQ